MKLNIKTTKTFTDIYHGSKIVCLQGGTRSGKSYASIQYAIVRALEEPGLMISVVRKSFPSLRISALRDFKEIMTALGIWDDNQWRASENTYIFDNGSMVEFLSVQDSERRKGTKRDILLIDEANELDYEDYFQLFIRTADKVILCYNPSFPPQTHWITQQVHTHPEATIKISTYTDNPFLEDSIVMEIERLKTTSPSYWTVYGTGQFGMIEGLIFDNFSVTDIIEEDAILLGYGLDFGFTADETALIALWKGKEHIYFDEVFYEKGLLMNEIGNLVKGAYDVEGRAPIIADSSEPRGIEELFRMGINIKPAVKGKDSIIAGIDIMKQHNILITKRSKNLIDEFYSYQWMKDKANNIINQPDGRSKDHGIDAARYISSFMLSQKKRNYGTYTISLR
jgi:phage terminase large subunit